MNDELIIIAIVAAAALLVLLIVKLASFLRIFMKDARYICHEMDCAHSYEEYRRWCGELRCHYLCLIPFVNEKNVMRVYRLFFHSGDHARKEDRRDSIVPLLMPSILGVCLCLVCVCGMTWAWYSASVQTPPQKMTAAYYEVTVELVMNGETKIDPKNGGYTLNAGTPYTVSLKAAGNAKERGGYCLIECGDTKYYTQTFKPEESITIEFKTEITGTYTFTGVWGSHPVGVIEENIIKRTDAENAVVASADDLNMIPETVDTISDPDPASIEPSAEKEMSGAYTVQSGDTLSAIADSYNTTAAKLAAHNGMTDANAIRVGQIIKIPPEDWEFPAADSTSPEHPETDLPFEPMESISETSEASQPNQENMPEKQETTENSTASDPRFTGEPKTDSMEDSSTAE